jgi:hypothetical protein
VSDCSEFLVALLHQSCGFASDQAESDDVRFHGSVEFDGVFRVKQEAFGDDASVVDEQVNATANVFDPSSGRINVNY